MTSRKNQQQPCLSFQELADHIQNVRQHGQKAIALLPVGCIEQHGPFLPIETDSLIASAFAEDLCSALPANDLWGYVFQTIHYSPTRSNLQYCGTISVNEEHFRRYVKDIGNTLLASPFDALVIISGHGPADPSLREISFTLVHTQFLQQALPLRPVLVKSLYAESMQLEPIFAQQPGKHADWREFLLLYHILGAEYFDAARMQALEAFRSSHDFQFQPSAIIGIPVQHRSICGVIGEPLPTIQADWKILADKLWNLYLETITQSLQADLEAFWTDYTDNLKDNRADLLTCTRPNP